MEAIIIDTETTGVDEPQVVEMAWREFPALDGKTPDFFVQRFRPDKPMEYGAIATHHILPSELGGAPSHTEAPSLIPRVPYWIGHNVDFDWKTLGCPQVKRICTLAIARSVWPNHDSHTLVAMNYFLRGTTQAVRDDLLGAHGAAVDITLCLPILATVMEVEGIRTMEELWAFSERCRIPTVMSFGKWKGYKVSEVDRGYATWYDRESARTGDRDEYLIKAFRLAGKL